MRKWTRRVAATAAERLRNIRGGDMGRDCGETRTSNGGDTTDARDGDAQDTRKRRRDRKDHRTDNGRARGADTAAAHARRHRQTPGRSGETKRRKGRRPEKVAETEKGRQWTGHARSRRANRWTQHEDPKPSPPRRKKTARNTEEKAIPIRVSLLQCKRRQHRAHRRCRSPASAREPFRCEGRKGGCERICLLLPWCKATVSSNVKSRRVDHRWGGQQRRRHTAAQVMATARPIDCPNRAGQQLASASGGVPG